MLHEIDVALLAHELIKIRVFSDDRAERERCYARICAELDAAPVQHLGKLLVVWRLAPEPEPEPVAARAAPRKPAKGAKRRRARADARHWRSRATRQQRRAARTIEGRPARTPRNVDTRRDERRTAAAAIRMRRRPALRHGEHAARRGTAPLRRRLRARPPRRRRAP